MIKTEELSNPSSCMNRAKPDEMTFVLLGRDAAAPVAIRAWIEERIRLGKNRRDDPQIVEAEQCAAAMMKVKPPWASYCEIFPQAERKILVRFTGVDGIYRWLHPLECRWVEEPEQINMPMFSDWASARSAADKSPEPPTWQEVVFHQEWTTRSLQ